MDSSTDQSSTEYVTTELGGTTFTVPKRYQNIRLITFGGRGVVCAGYDSVRDQNVAIKKLHRPFRSRVDAQRTYRECVLMKLVSHENVLGLLSAFTPQKSLDEFQDVYLVTELMEADLRRIARLDLTHEHISYLMYQILCGIKHLHSAGVLHRDLKPSSIVVNSDCSLKILDLATARCAEDDEIKTQYVMTRFYRAPEVLLGIGYTESVDIWAAGCILGELIKGSVLFPGVSSVNQWNKIVEQLGTPSQDFIEKLRPAVKEYIENDWKHGSSFEQLFPDNLFPVDSTEHEGLCCTVARDLLSKMLVIDPSKRLSVQEVLQHPYIKLWYDEDEVNSAASGVYDQAIEEKEYTVQQLKEMIYSEIMESEKKDQESGSSVPAELPSDPRTMELYEIAIREGKEKDTNIRVMAIGCYGQGKSSLVRRLMGQSLEGVESTNSIEIQTCNSVADHPEIWEIKRCTPDSMYTESVRRLVSVARSKSMRLLLEKPTEKSDHPNVYTDIDKSDTSDVKKNTKMQTDEESKWNEIMYGKKPNTVEDMEVDTASTNAQTATEAAPSKIPSVHSVEFQKEFKKSDKAAKDDLCVNINIWDFGGQFVYYATHQLFHSRLSVYLLAFNIANGLKMKVYDEECPNKMQEKTMEEYLKFWVNSVHTFVGNEEGTEPPIFLVGTHLDMVDEHCDIDDCFEDVRTLFDDTKCAYHIQAKHFAISNTNPDEAVLTDLRRSILEYVAKQSVDRFIPAKWIPLERSLRENCQMKIISFEKLKEIDSLNEIPVTSEEQLKLFLHYHHEKGTFFYFENEDDAINHVVLQPQFLIDAFRCIITAGKFCRVHPNLRKLWHKLCNEAILEKELLHELWSKDPEKEFMKFEKALLFFLQRHRIIAEALAFDDNSASLSPVPLSFYIVPSLLKKPAEGMIEAFLCRKRYTKVSLGYIFEYETVLYTIYNRVTAAALGRWPVLEFTGKSFIFENAVVCQIDLSHAGLLKIMDRSLEMLVVNLCHLEDVSSDVCDTFRRFVENVIEQELHKFQGSDSRIQGHIYKEMMRCYDESHSFNGSMKIYETETLRGYSRDIIGCPDHCSHSIHIHEVMAMWFKFEIVRADLPKRNLTDKELSKLSTAFGRDWEYFVRQLGFSDAEIEQVCLDKPTTPSRIYELFRRWRNRAGDDGTLDVLVKAILECRSFITINEDVLKNLIDGIL